ncbi:hypothetical protein ACSMXN_20720 [Jatrophihabitans sp. DSM 45814]
MRTRIKGTASLIRANGVGRPNFDDVMTATATSKSQLFHYVPQMDVTICCLPSLNTKPTRFWPNSTHTFPISPRSFPISPRCGA